MKIRSGFVSNSSSSSYLIECDSKETAERVMECYRDFKDYFLKIHPNSVGYGMRDCIYEIATPDEIEAHFRNIPESSKHSFNSSNAFLSEHSLMSFKKSFAPLNGRKRFKSSLDLQQTRNELDDEFETKTVLIFIVAPVFMSFTTCSCLHHLVFLCFTTVNHKMIEMNSVRVFAVIANFSFSVFNMFHEIHTS